MYYSKENFMNISVRNIMERERMGIPIDDHIHTQLPQARIISSDIDPDIYALAQQLVGKLPNVRYFQQDSASRSLYLSRPPCAIFSKVSDEWPLA